MVISLSLPVFFKNIFKFLAEMKESFLLIYFTDYRLLVSGSVQPLGLKLFCGSFLFPLLPLMNGRVTFLLNVLWLLTADQQRARGIKIDTAKIIIATAMCFNWKSHYQTLLFSDSFLKLLIMHFLILNYLSWKSVFA